MGVDRQHMKNIQEVKMKIEELQRNAELHNPMACPILGPDLLIRQTSLVSKLEILYWVLGEKIPDYECQKDKPSLQNKVT
jgi:hypothetical protein